MTPAVVVVGFSLEAFGAFERTHRLVGIAARELEFVLAREMVQVVVIVHNGDLDDTCRDLARCADRLRKSGAACIVVGAADVDRLERSLDGVRHYICPGQPELSSIAALVRAVLDDAGALPVRSG